METGHAKKASRTIFDTRSLGAKLSQRDRADPQAEKNAWQKAVLAALADAPVE